MRFLADENFIGDAQRYERLKDLHIHLKELRTTTRHYKVGYQLIANVWKIIFTFFLMPAIVSHHITDKNIGPWTALFQSDLSQRFTTIQSITYY